MNELGRDKLPGAQPNPWATNEKTPALSKAAQPTAGTDAQAEPQGERPVPKLVLEKDLLDVFGPSFADDVVTYSTPTEKHKVVGKQAEKPVAKADAKPAPPATDAAALQTELKNNPRALRTLAKITEDKAFQSLSAEDRGSLLTQFKSAPNAATAEYLLGVAEYKQASAADKSGDPAAAKARTDKLTDRKNPDSGTMVKDGITYTIKDGKLLDKSGKDAGTIDNLGNYQLTGDKTPSNYYNDIHARVVLKEGEGKSERTLLDLHDVDPNGLLEDGGMNDTFVGKAEDTFRSLRKEGLDMGTAPQGSFRSFEEQDKLYAKGRTRPGRRVTNARGGESFHNYGVAADIAFYDEKGTISWPEDGDYAKLWTRYGEHAKKQGLEWGGDWKSITDRPHIEYHPGVGSASSLKAAHQRGGNEAAWDQMGIGEIPNRPSK